MSVSLIVSNQSQLSPAMQRSVFRQCVRRMLR